MSHFDKSIMKGASFTTPITLNERVNLMYIYNGLFGNTPVKVSTLPQMFFNRVIIKTNISPQIFNMEEI